MYTPCPTLSEISLEKIRGKVQNILPGNDDMSLPFNKDKIWTMKKSGQTRKVDSLTQKK